MVYFWPLALANVAEGYISVKRIEEFLLASEKKPQAVKHQETVIVDGNAIIDEKTGKKSAQTNGVALGKLSDSDSVPPKRIVDVNAKLKGIVMKHLTATWESGDKQNSGIYDFNLVVPDGQLCAIVGPVGAGENFGLRKSNQVMTVAFRFR